MQQFSRWCAMVKNSRVWVLRGQQTRWPASAPFAPNDMPTIREMIIQFATACPDIPAGDCSAVEP